MVGVLLHGVETLGSLYSSKDGPLRCQVYSYDTCSICFFWLFSVSVLKILLLFLSVYVVTLDQYEMILSEAL